VPLAQRVDRAAQGHADLVVFSAVAGHLAAAGEEHKIRGAVPLFDHVQAFVDLAAEFC